MALIPPRILDTRRSGFFGHGIVNQHKEYQDQQYQDQQYRHQDQNQEGLPPPNAPERRGSRPGVRVIVGGNATTGTAASSSPSREWRTPPSSRSTPLPDKSPRKCRPGRRPSSENALKVAAESGLSAQRSSRRSPERSGAMPRSGNGRGVEVGGKGHPPPGKNPPPPGRKPSIDSPSHSSLPLTTATAPLRQFEGRRIESGSPGDDASAHDLENRPREEAALVVEKGDTGGGVGGRRGSSKNGLPSRHEKEVRGGRKVVRGGKKAVRGGNNTSNGGSKEVSDGDESLRGGSGVSRSVGVHLPIPQEAENNRGVITTSGVSEEREINSREAEIAAIRSRVRGIQARSMRGESRESRAMFPEGGGSANASASASPSPGVRPSSTVFTGHDGQVLALAHRGDRLFSAAADGTAKAWDTTSHRCLATYIGHRKAVWGMQVTSRTLITGSADGTVRFWDIETAQPLHVIDLRSAVRDIVVAGDFLAAATSSASVEVVDLHGMRRHGALRGHLLAVSSLTSLEGGSRLVSGSHDTFIRIWNPKTGSCDAVLSGHRGTVGALCIISRPPSLTANRGDHPDLSMEEVIVSGSGDATVRLWGRADRSDSAEWGCLAILEGHRHGVWAVHGLATGGVFASGGGDATVKVWAPKTATDTASAEIGGDATTTDPASSKRREDSRNGVIADTRGQNGNAGLEDSIRRDDNGVIEDKRGRGENVVEDEGGGERGRRWECVGGVRGAVGAVGTIMMTEDALMFGTSEALIASFPLQSCMPVRGQTFR